MAQISQKRMVKMVTSLTEGKPAKALFFFTLPMLLGNVFQQLYNLADSVIVGQVVGKDGLGAVGASFGVTFLSIGIATGASQGCAIIISQCFGAKDSKKVKSGLSTAMISVIVLGAIMWIASLFFLRPLLTLLQTPPDIFESSYAYARIVFLGCIFMFTYNSLAAIFNALGDSKTPLKFLIASTLLNIVLDIIFVAGFGMGVQGAAVATLTAQILSAVGLLIYFLHKIKSFGFEEEKAPIFDVLLLKNMVRIAIPSMIQQSMVSIGMMAVQGLVNTFGTDMVAGYTAATKVDSIATMPMLNIGIALSTYTAQNLGARKTLRVKQGYYAALKLAAIFCVVMTAAILIFGKFFINVFMDSTTGAGAITIGTEYLQIVSIFYFLFGIMCITNGVLRGSGDMKAFMASTFVNIAARIGFAYALAPIMGYAAIFWSIPLGWLLSGIISFTRYVSGKWNKSLPDIIKTPDA